MAPKTGVLFQISFLSELHLKERENNVVKGKCFYTKVAQPFKPRHKSLGMDKGVRLKNV